LSASCARRDCLAHAGRLEEIWACRLGEGSQKDESEDLLPRYLRREVKASLHIVRGKLRLALATPPA